MKEYLDKFNKFRKDPKKKSISLLIIYGIFFIFVFIYIKSGTPINNYNEINNETINTVSNYEYVIEFNINNEVMNINGIYLNNQNKLNIDNKYNVNDNIISYNNISIDSNLIINKLNYNSLDNFFKNYEYESKTEYKDGNIKYEYIINNNDITKYLNIDLNEGNTNISVIKNDYINEVNINLSDNYSIKIKYNNINNISSIDTK